MEDGDRERAHSSGGRIFFRVCCKLLSQVKIDGAHGVDSWVWGPHGCEDMSHGAYLFLHASFFNRLVVGCKDACADLVSEYL